MAFQKLVIKCKNLLRFLINIHEIIFHSAKESSPFEEVASAGDHQGTVCAVLQYKTSLTKCFPEIFFVGMIPWTVNHSTPDNLSHLFIQIIVVFRIIFFIWEVLLVKTHSAIWHLGNECALAVKIFIRAIFVMSRPEPARPLCGNAV